MILVYMHTNYFTTYFEHLHPCTVYGLFRYEKSVIDLRIWDSSTSFHWSSGSGYISESQWTTAALHFLLIQFPVSVWFKSQLMRLWEFSKLICRLKWVYTLYYQYVLFVNMSCYKNSKLMSVMLSNYITCGTDYFHFEHLKLWWQIWKMWPY